jgi:hypothetical protein
MHKDEQALASYEFPDLDEMIERGAAEVLGQPFRCLEDVMIDANTDTGSSGTPLRGGAIPATLASATGSLRTTIRIPGHLILAIRREAARRGVKYQSLIIQLLQGAAAHW